MAPEPDDGDRLAAQERQLRLLVAHLAGRAVRARVEVDDLVQEVYVRALTAPGGLPPRGADDSGETALLRFLARIARNAVIDAARAIRAAKRQGRVERIARSEWTRVGPRESRIAANTPGPSTRVAAVEEHARVVAAFEKLAPDHRRVLGLRRFEGLSAREAALRMGRSETAVHSLYRRALLAWEEALG